jgi:holo-[acyl-carrier protein] synthase
MQVVGIGTDIVECLRIAKMLERHGELFTNRVYTPQEIEYCSSRKAAIQHFSSYWAAKESVLKAIGTSWVRGISWRDVEVVTDPSGQPSIQLSGGTLEICERKGIQRVLISLAHCRAHATATAVALG